MSTKSSPQADMSPAAKLRREPYGFDFFQAVHLLAVQAGRSATASQTRQEVGHDFHPDEEIVRFRAQVSHAFPSGAIAEFHAQPPSSTEDGAAPPPEMIVPFLGLIGPQGVLPRHYTQMAIDRVRARDTALRDFLDLFHHRVISHFYRAWAKYHFPVLYETVMRSAQVHEGDLFTRSLYCLIGLGTPGLRGRRTVPDEALLYYAGLFAHFPRDATSLERMIGEYFCISARILQFQGQWLRLEEAEQTCLTTPKFARGWNNTLGETAVAGERVWGVESKFRVQVGPLTFAQFLRFSPLGDRLPQLVQMVRTYVGSDLDFEVQPLLRRADIPACRLGDHDCSRLGWTTWVRSQEATRDADEAVFAPEGDLLC